MPSWGEVEAEATELAALARRFLDAHVHKILATLRRDGSPRVSGTEVDFAEGELWLGNMWPSLRRSICGATQALIHPWGYAASDGHKGLVRY
jgi:hypothetical protein